MTSVKAGLQSALRPAARIPQGRRWTVRDLGRYSILVALVNLTIAAGLSVSADAPGSFWAVLLYSQCIGMSIYMLHMLLGCLLLPGSRNIQVILRIAIAAPVGYSLGANSAALMRGDPSPGLLFFGVPPFQIMVTILATICVVYFVWSRGRIHEEMAAHARAEQYASEARLRLLRAQLEPHMLFNTLANLRILVEVDAARAQTMIDQLIVFLRGSLSASRAEMRTLEIEFDQLRAYLDLMKIRMAERLDFELELPAALKDAEIPAMLLQPLLENAIKHGLEPALAGGRVTVSVAAHDEQLEIEVLDTGLGLGGNQHPEGYGLTHIKERLEALYGKQAHFLIEAAPGGGTRCLVSLPMLPVAPPRALQ